MFWDAVLGVVMTGTGALLYALFRAPTLPPDDVRGLSDRQIEERNIIARDGAKVIRLFRSGESSE